MQHLRSFKFLIVAALLAIGFGGGAVAIAQTGLPDSNGQVSLQDSTPGTVVCDDDDMINGTPDADRDADDDDDRDDDRDDDGDRDDDDDALNGTPGVDDDCGAPGELVEGQHLQSQATVTLDEAITIAQGAAQGDLGVVTLDEENGRLVYEVQIGNQDVVIDAMTGEVIEIDQDRDDDRD